MPSNHKTTKLPQKPSKGTFIRVERSILKAVKVTAAEREISMTELVTEAVCTFLGIEKPKKESRMAA